MNSAAASAPTAPTVLIVEDYSDTRELISTMLRTHGFNVIEAEDGLEGLLKASGMYTDLIIMDLSLPEMDGVEAARRIHASPKLSRIPIIVISAYLTEEVKADIRGAGCIAAFPKPFDTEILLGMITSAIRKEAAAGTAKIQ